LTHVTAEHASGLRSSSTEQLFRGHRIDKDSITSSFKNSKEDFDFSIMPRTSSSLTPMPDKDSYDIVPSHLMPLLLLLLTSTTPGHDMRSVDDLNFNAAMS
jgi:hypothetical protein